MPVTRAIMVQEHREKLGFPTLPFSACVARSVKPSEYNNNKKALEALLIEWNKLRRIKCWDETTVREKADVIAEYKRTGRKAHFARLFEICVEKGSELPEGHPGRKFKGRVVVQGNNVKDEGYTQAIFAELSSCPSTMQAGKSCDAFGLIESNKTEQCDAEQAYTQATLKGTDTWIIIPRERQPESWKRFREPVCLLKLALYGHPDSGGYWEKHCEEKVALCGFRPIPEWRSCFKHDKLGLFLTVYVDDFKMSGPANNLKIGWDLIRQHIKTEDPTPSGKYLAAEHVLGKIEITDKINPLHPKLQERSRENAAKLPVYDGNYKKRFVRGIYYDMKGFMSQCVEVYSDLANLGNGKLPTVLIMTSILIKSTKNRPEWRH